MKSQDLSQTFDSLPVLVTGASGFIGSHLVKRLVDLKAQVTIIKRAASSIWRLESVIKNLKVIEVDLLQESELRKLLRNHHFQVIFHLAAVTDHDRSVKLLQNSFSNNMSGTLNLTRCFFNRRIKAFINVGTCEEYGNNVTPFHEQQREQPVSPYSASKVAVTHCLQMLYRIFGFPSVTVRPFLTYGPGQISNQLIPYCISQALQGLPIYTTAGDQTREFHYVSDIVSGILLAATQKKTPGEVIDLGTGKEYKIKDVVKLILQLTHSSSPWYIKVPNRLGEVDRFYCRGQKARQLLGWKPHVVLKDGLTETIIWYRKYLQTHERGQT